MSIRLDKERLLELMDRISHPQKYGLTQKALDQSLVDFCAGCPDPVQARWLVVESPDPMSDEEIVDRAISMSVVSMAQVPMSVVPAGHPARAAAD